MSQTFTVAVEGLGTVNPLALQRNLEHVYGTRGRIFTVTETTPKPPIKVGDLVRTTTYRDPGAISVREVFAVHGDRAWVDSPDHPASGSIFPLSALERIGE